MKHNTSLFLLLVSISILLFSISCRSTFPESEFANFENPPDHEEVIPQFRNTWPEKLSMDQTAVIEIGFHKIAGLGLCSYDSETGDISLALMTTTGVKLLEILRQSGKSKTRFSMPELAEKDTARNQLILDVATIYIQPGGKYKYCELRKNSIVYGWVDKSKNRTELIFGIPIGTQDLRLMKKKLYYDNALVSVVYYMDYKEINGKCIPMLVGYRNKKFGYSLILKNNKVYDD